MMPPRPKALRLWTGTPGRRSPTVPLGLNAWSPDADAIAVLIEARDGDPDEPADVATQIPPAEELPPNTLVFIMGAAVRCRGVLRWLGVRTVAVSRAARCTALVARGYVRVGAGVDPATGADLAWGVSSLS